MWAGVAPSLGRTEVLALLAAFSGAEMGAGWPEPPVGPSQHCVSPPPQCLPQRPAGRLRKAPPQGVSPTGSGMDYMTPSDAG